MTVNLGASLRCEAVRVALPPPLVYSAEETADADGVALLNLERVWFGGRLQVHEFGSALLAVAQLSGEVHVNEANHLPAALPGRYHLYIHCTASAAHQLLGIFDTHTLSLGGRRTGAQPTVVLLRYAWADLRGFYSAAAILLRREKRTAAAAAAAAAERAAAKARQQVLQQQSAAQYCPR